MERRKVVITIEATTDEPLDHIRGTRHLVLQRPGYSNCRVDVDQIQVNVIRTKAPKKR